MVPEYGPVPSRWTVSTPEPLFDGSALEKTNDVLFVSRRSGTPSPDNVALSAGSESGGKLYGTNRRRTRFPASAATFQNGTPCRGEVADARSSSFPLPSSFGAA